MRILNAGEAAYPEGWVNYQPCASYDRVNWFRVPARYEDGVLIIEHTRWPAAFITLTSSRIPTSNICA